jgi:hypothetical protein
MALIPRIIGNQRIQNGELTAAAGGTYSHHWALMLRYDPSLCPRATRVDKRSQADLPGVEPTLLGVPRDAREGDRRRHRLFIAVSA